MGRALKKIKCHPDSVLVNGTSHKRDNMPEEMRNPKLEINNSSKNRSDIEIDTHSFEKDGSKLEDKKSDAFVGGPSSSDPYSMGVDTDELKVSLASQAISTPGKSMNALPPETPLGNVGDQSLGDPDPAPLLQETSGPEEQTSLVKSLKDAVKSKRRRKKKNHANTEGS